MTKEEKHNFLTAIIRKKNELDSDQVQDYFETVIYFLIKYYV